MSFKVLPVNFYHDVQAFKKNNNSMLILTTRSVKAKFNFS